ncbi:MAG: HEAT repeat domain-containing protein, partial [Agrococcus sp.]
MPSIVQQPGRTGPRFREYASLARDLPLERALETLETAALEAPTTDRLAAIRALGLVSEPSATLMGLANDEERRIQLAALTTIGKVGGRDLLEPLAELDAREDPAIDRQRRFARALISHRAGVETPIADDAGVDRTWGDGDEVTEMGFREMPATQPGQAFDSLVSGGFGLEASDNAYELACGASRFAVFVTRDLDDGASALFARPRLLGLVAYVLADAPAVQYVVLSRPEGDGGRITVLRTDGETAYAGVAVPSGDGFSFTVTDVGRPGTAPTRIDGR